MNFHFMQWFMKLVVYETRVYKVTKGLGFRDIKLTGNFLRPGLKSPSGAISNPIVRLFVCP